MTNQLSEQDDLGLVSTWMQDFASEPLESAGATDAAVLWWKAQLLRRWDAERKATAPIEVGEQIQVLIGVVGTLGALAWLWPELSPASGGSLLFGVLLLTAVLAIAAAALSAWNALDHN